MTSQTDKAETFRALHSDGCFLIPNPWDVGSARILQGLGFKALATTSAGFANAQGVNDYNVTRDMVLTHARALCNATTIPVSADLENGFGDSPEHCAETIRLAADAGLVGGSIEDFAGQDRGQYDIDRARERIAAAAEAARALPFFFMLTARAENFFTGTPDLADTIARLQAYQEAGADVLFAPGLRTLDDIRSVVASIDLPLNVLIGPKSGPVPVAELATLGVRRISLGSALANAANGALIRAAQELLQTGTFGFTKDGIGGAQLMAIMNDETPGDR
ncbi:MAG TPA: isocitrate lyase/phosphoenolpyruvate mutase family protein [Henriciella marina]|uniref:isocitrate lyase/PEP mutase family protein n=1 Tax=Henriciella sp. TaxID=1968823 RepID=UPI0017A7DB70|nr:isocitrate lyase/phosphoenolpyruvate mutase family protein [Henriciella sp.]HIG21451.1 isocitrate lyase/phosphoenolpyruvate mutase family protein [Henriciella sp.]HIK63689.1 isocitrate lyase/phosphoenolpyruvate mutase family protein [Henriciella marina]